VSTLVVSDLHLGSRAGVDVLRQGLARRALEPSLAEVDRLVLLGDTLELRQGPVREALAGAEATLGWLGEAMGEGEVVLVAGNHDHALVESWLDTRGADRAPPPLELEQIVEPATASWIAERVARSVRARRPQLHVTVAYPGVWVRDDVYATHGHYLDLHSTLPAFERLAAGAMSRLAGSPPLHAPDDYEALLAPIYAWIHTVAQRAESDGVTRGGASARAWRRLAGGQGGPLRARALASLVPLGIGAINRAGLGPVSPTLSREQVRRAGVRGMAAVSDALDLSAQHVIFGHSHRAGPLPGDEPTEWRSDQGVALLNAGCWVYETHFMPRPGPDSPFWPGRAVLVKDKGPPQLLGLLDDRSAEELVGASVRLSSTAQRRSPAE